MRPRRENESLTTSAETPSPTGHNSLVRRRVFRGTAFTCVSVLVAVWWCVTWLATDSHIHPTAYPSLALPEFELRLRQAPSLKKTRVVSSTLSEQIVPLECTHLLLHAFDTWAEVEANELWVRRQAEWMTASPSDCFASVVVSAPDRRPATVSRLRQSASTASPSEGRATLDVQAALSRMALQGAFKTPPGDGVSSAGDGKGTPWVLSTDLAVLPLNRAKSIQSLVERVSAGVALGNTTETRVCGGDGVSFKCSPAAALVTQTVRSVDSIALAVSVNPMCGQSSLLDTNTALWRPSRLVGFIAQSARRLPVSASAAQETVLRELFGWREGAASALACATTQGVWDDNDELVSLLRLNLTRAFTHPLFRETALLWFPDARFWPGEPDAVALLHPRWMNAPVCMLSETETPVKLRVECRDMLAQFRQCAQKTAAYRDASFRHAIAVSRECRQNLPFLSNDANSGAFDADAWLAGH